MIEGKQQKIESRKRKYGKGSITLEQRRSLVLPLTWEDLPITMEATLTMEEVLITTVVPGMEMGMERVAIRTVLTQPHPPRRTKVTLLVSSAGRLDIMPMSVLKQTMVMAMEALGRRPTLSTGDK